MDGDYLSNSGQYLNGESYSQDYVSPLLAHIPESFPPTLLITAQCDPLRDEGTLFGEKLSDSGVVVESIQYKSMIQGFISFYPILTKGKKAIRKTSNYVEQYFQLN